MSDEVPSSIHNYDTETPLQPELSPLQGLLISVVAVETTIHTGPSVPPSCCELLHGVEFPPECQPLVDATQSLAALPHGSAKEVVVPLLNVLGEAITALPEGALKERLWPLLMEKIVPYTCS